MRLYCFKSRSFRLPNIFLRRPVTMTFARKVKPQSLAPGRGSANAREALDCIETNSPLGLILQKAENSLHLQQAFALSLNKNGLGRAVDLVKIGNFSEHNGELKIYTNNSAVAARLQQKLPSILLNLQDQGWAVQFLTIKQSPKQLSIDSVTNTHQPEKPPVFTETAQKSWSSLLEQLDGESPLKAAIKNLLKRRR
jgi:hypothetical protein